MDSLKNPIRWLIAAIAIVGFIMTMEAMGYSPGIFGIGIAGALVFWIVFFGIKIDPSTNSNGE